MTDEWKALLDEARGRRKDGLLRRWAHYECLKDKLREMGNEEGTIDVSDDPVHPTYMP